MPVAYSPEKVGLHILLFQRSAWESCGWKLPAGPVMGKAIHLLRSATSIYVSALTSMDGLRGRPSLHIGSNRLRADVSF